MHDLHGPGATRRDFLALLAVAPGCAWLLPKDEITRARDRGVAWLLAQQKPDGGFKSDVYGLMRSGHSLTPLALLALATAGEGPSAASSRALDFLVGAVDSTGALGLLDVPDYPMYATSLAVLALHRYKPPGWDRPAARMAEWIRGQQLTGSSWLGHPSRGGFPMGAREARTPPHAGHVDLSMTRRALQALAAVGVPSSDPAMDEGRRFVESCHTADGAFRYSPGEPALNKGRDPDAGYGTPTCDAVLALLATGGSDGLATTGISWLNSRFRIDENPGVGHTAMRRFGLAMKYYWRASVAEVFQKTSSGPSRWSDQLAVALVEEQKPDGSWTNSLPDQKEDDPVVCTSLALLALGVCRSLG